MSISKRLEDARKAFEKKDVNASARAHDLDRIRAKEEHGGAGSEYLSNIVYGSLDGIITTFAVVSGVAGAHLSSGILLIMGLANLFGDGFSMATGAYLSSKSDSEFYTRERLREGWEVRNFPEGEKQELLEIYREKGYPDADAANLVEIKTRDPERWIETMMVEELGLLPERRSPLKQALVTFAAFAIAGSVPLIVYLLDLIFHFQIAASTNFLVSLILSGAALFGLGAAKVFVTRRNALRSGLEMLVVGGLAAGVAYLVGALLQGLGG